MKLHSGLLLLCLTLTVSSRAEEVMPVKTEAAGVKRELVWPEIKDPQALIEYAKAEIRRVGEGDRKWGWPMTLKPEFDYLHAAECFVQPAYLFIELETHPEAGQALLVVPNLNLLDETMKGVFTKIEETKTPGIKRVLFPLSAFSDYGQALYKAHEHGSVRWRSLDNLSKGKNTWPIPLEFSLPQYPVDAMRQGVEGEARIELIVTGSGSISSLVIKATHEDFASAVRKVVQSWRFEPGVDLETRLPAETLMSFAVRFSLIEG